MHNLDPDEGFTLIELLVVVVVVGILAAIGLPNLIEQIAKARTTEAKVNISAVMRAQQAYYYERGTFAPNFADLDVQVRQNARHYDFEIQPGGDAASNVVADPKDDNTLGYVGVTYLAKTPGEQQISPTVLVCEGTIRGTAPGIVSLDAPSSSEAECPVGSRPVK